MSYFWLHFGGTLGHQRVNNVGNSFLCYCPFVCLCRTTVFPEMLGKMCHALMECDETYPEWLYGVPLLHYLRGQIIPYQPATVTLGPSALPVIYAELPVAQHHFKIAKKESRYEAMYTCIIAPLQKFIVLVLFK